METVYYISMHDQKTPFVVYSKVMTDFGSQPAENFVREFETYEEAESFIKKMEGKF